MIELSRPCVTSCVQNEFEGGHLKDGKQVNMLLSLDKGPAFSVATLPKLQVSSCTHAKHTGALLCLEDR
jgi:hypothetical protein